MSLLPDDLELNYSKLPAIAIKKKSENEEFKLHLKKFSAQEIDEIFLPIAEEIAAIVDCTQCGNCCRHLEPGITDEEAGRLALLKGMSKEIFIHDFTGKETSTE